MRLNRLLLGAGCAALLIALFPTLSRGSAAPPWQPRAAQAPPPGRVREAHPPTASIAPAGFQENTYNWFAGDHSGWKALSNYPTGYVLAGSKFFEPNNTSLFITGFNDLSQQLWTKTLPL